MGESQAGYRIYMFFHGVLLLPGLESETSDNVIDASSKHLISCLTHANTCHWILVGEAVCFLLGSSIEHFHQGTIAGTRHQVKQPPRRTDSMDYCCVSFVLLAKLARFDVPYDQRLVCGGGVRQLVGMLEAQARNGVVVALQDCYVVAAP